MPDDKQKKVSIGDEDEFMRDMRNRFKEAENGMSDIVDAALDDIKMLDGENQWDPDVKAFRESKGMIMITENLLPSFVDQVEGDFRQNKPQVDCIGVDDKADPETARIMGGMIRNIDYQSQAEMIYNEAFLSMLASSYGAWRIHTRYEDPMSFNKEIYVAPIENHLSLRWDMSCKLFDTSDKKWVQISDVISKEEYEQKYGKDHPITAQVPKGDEYNNWFLDKGYRICEYWCIKEKPATLIQLSDGRNILKTDENALQKLLRMTKGITVIDERKTYLPVVYTSIVSGSEILEGPFEWPGKYIPIPICFGKRLNMNGKMRLKSLIRDAKESQRMHNGLISSMTQDVIMHQSSPYVGTTEQFEGKKAEWTEAINGNLPFVTYNKDPGAPGPPQKQTSAAFSTGYAQLLAQNATTRRDIIGIHEAGLGMRSNETSGKAILARQREGDVGTFVFVDNFRFAKIFDGRIKVDLIPKIYDTARMQRILGIDNKDEFVQLYEKTVDPRTGRPILKANLKVGKYDVVVKTGPSFTTQREETKAAMVDVMQAIGPNSPATGVLLPAVIKNMDWQDSDKIAQALTAMLPPNIQQILSGQGQDGKTDPKIQAVQQAMQQQVAQMQAQFQQQGQAMQEAMQKLQQENMQLKSGLQAKMAEIDAKKELSREEAQLRREEIMAEMTNKEKELQHTYDLKMQEIQANMALEFRMFKEKLDYERSVAKEQKTQVQESVQVRG